MQQLFLRLFRLILAISSIMLISVNVEAVPVQDTLRLDQNQQKIQEKVVKVMAPSDTLATTGTLKELTVTADRQEVMQKEDTTVVDATAFKTPEGSDLEELIKRIPGLDYDKDTKQITFQGKQISGINLNGEMFFGGDIGQALKNLTADVVSKIKIYDKQTELEKITGVDDGQENYILDVQTKRTYNGSVLLSGQGGYGNHHKKNFNFSGNLFKTNGENISMMGRSSNQNMNTDYLGNISNNTGLNFVKKFDKKLTFNMGVFYNRNKNGNSNTSYNEQYLTSRDLYRISEGNSINDSRRLNVSLGMRYEIDKRTFLNVQGSFNSSWNNSTNNSCNATFDNRPEVDYADPFAHFDATPDSIRLNSSTMSSSSNSRTTNYSISVDFTRRLNEKGTSISLTAGLSGNNRRNESVSNSSTIYYRLQNTEGNDSILTRDLRQFSPSKNNTSSIGLMFTQPLSKHLRLQLSYDFRYSRESSERNTYGPVEFVDSLSNKSRSNSLMHRVKLSFNYTYKKVWRIDGGLALQPRSRSLEQKKGLLQADSTLHTIEYKPHLNIRWRRGDNTLNFMYRGNSTPPDLSDLMVLTDNSNPLNITMGNPNLKQSYDQTFSFRYSNFKKGISANMSYRNEYNSKATSVIYNAETGGRESMPVNVNGNWSLNGQVKYEKRINAFRLAGHIGGTQSHRVGLMNDGSTISPQRSLTKNGRLNARLRAAFLPDWGSFELSGNWGYNHSVNDLKNSNIYTRNYGLGLNAFAELPGGLQLKTDADYSFRNGTNITPGEDDQFVWNAGLTWRFLKKKKAELSFYWADIFSKRKSYSRSTTDTGFYERHSRQIGSYFMVSFKYRLNIPLMKG